MRELLLILPLGSASALSPMMLTEQTVLLAGPNGRRVASRYAVGTALVVSFYVGALVFWGNAISLPKRPTLSARMDIALGALLIALAIIIQRRGHSGSRQRSSTHVIGPSTAIGFGVFAMATNFTTLALLLPAAKDIAASSVNAAGRVVLIAVLVLLSTMPAWVPIATTRVAPGPAARVLDALGDLISRRGKTLVVSLLAALAAVLVGRGVLHLARA